MQLAALFAHRDVACALLAHFTHADAVNVLRPVCVALARATQRQPRDAWLPLTSLRAALDRLRRRYDLDPSRRWLEPVAAITRALFALDAERHIAMLEPTPQDPARSVLGFHTIVVFRHREF